MKKKLAGKFHTPNVPIKDRQGNVLSKEEEVLKCWKDDFEYVFNMDDPKTEAVITPSENILDINTEPLDINEVKKALSSLKMRKLQR